MNVVTTIEPGGALISYADEHAAIQTFTQNAKAASTRRAYTSDMKAFVGWCRARGLEPMPALPHTVVWHLASAAKDGLSVSSLGRRVAGIAYAHSLAGYETPTGSKAVKEALAGIRRTVGAKPRRKTAATHDLIERMINCCPIDSMIGVRDRALLALGFAGAFRRSELAGLRFEDLELVEDGYKVTVRKSKTDQTSLGQTIAVPRGYRLRPVAAVQAWLAAAGIVEGPLLRQVHRSGAVRTSGLSGAAIATVVQRRAAEAGLDPREFAGHSLRSGFLTSAAEFGATVFAMTAVSRHKSIDVLAGYVRSAELFRNPAGQAFL